MNAIEDQAQGPAERKSREDEIRRYFEEGAVAARAVDEALYGSPAPPNTLMRRFRSQIGKVLATLGRRMER